MNKKTIKLSRIVELYKRKMMAAAGAAQLMGLNTSKDNECLIVNKNTAEAYYQAYLDEGYEIIDDLTPDIEIKVKSIPEDKIIDIETVEDQPRLEQKGKHEGM